MNSPFNFNDRIIKLSHECEQDIYPILTEIDNNQEENQKKILAAFIKNNISASDLLGSSGYGYSDKGRDNLDKLFSYIFNTEDSLVRHNFVSGTHAIATALFALLKPGQRLLSITGQPYDTLKEIIGLDNKSDKHKYRGSLKDLGISYKQIDLKPDGKLDLDAIANELTNSDLVYLQRSRGYSLRPSIFISQIKTASDLIKKINPNIIILVDNCYGEFVECLEPTDVGADVVVGSLIKNPGGGIARSGGYIAGKKNLIELCGTRLTAPGLGKDVGCSFDELRNMYLGIFLSAQAVANSLKTAVFASRMFEKAGFETSPKFNEKRTDIIQSIKLGSKEKMLAFCKGLQQASPIDSFVTPIPWETPGYEDEVIMAAGTFIMGASIELSADGPIREPFAVWLQGGLTFPAGKIGVMSALNEIMKI